MSRTFRLLALTTVAALAIPANCSLAVGFHLGESTEEIGVKYDG